MEAFAERFTAPRRDSFASRLAVLLTVFAFAMQSFIAQTHIHVEAQGHGGIVHITAAPAVAPGKTPPSNGKQTCPLCAAVAYAGAVLTPVVPFLFMPVWARCSAPLIGAVTIARTVAHNWQSRAPPRR
jgi:hypothetical protein